MRVVAGWLLLGLAAVLLVLNLSGGSSAGAGCMVVLVALVGLALVGGKEGESGLTRRQQGSAVAERKSFYGFEPLPRRGGVVSNELIDRLRDHGSE